MKYLFIVLLLVSIFVGYFFLDEYDYVIIKNNSIETITNVHLASSSATDTDSIFIGNLYPKSSYKYKLIESQNETSIDVIYMDSNKKNHRVDVIPYLILGQFKNYEFEIK